MATGIQRGDVVRCNTDIQGGGGLFSNAARYFIPLGSTGVVTDSPFLGDVEVRWDTGLIVKTRPGNLDVVHRAAGMGRNLFW